MLKRQGRTARQRRYAPADGSSSAQSPLFASTSSCSTSNALNIIVEEDETSSTSRSTSPLLGESSLKAKRRHANVSDIRIVRRRSSMPTESDISGDGDHHFSAPRPAPSPPSSASPSPDSFELTFQFPHPPTSPTSILGYYACESPSSDGMPVTPATSDDEHTQTQTQTRLANARRVSIRPLVINKHSQRILGAIEEQEQQKEEEEVQPMCEDAEFDSDSESDSEWYTREFSKILSLRSPVPATFPAHAHAHAHSAAARRDSLFVDADDTVRAQNTVTVASNRRDSKALPPTPSPRLSKVFIPSYPPPPVPTGTQARTSPVPSFASDPSSTESQNAIRRPPPRFSVPADFDLAMNEDKEEEEEEEEEEDDASSAFSFSIYDIDLGDADFTRPPAPNPPADLSQSPSPRSSYSQPSLKSSSQDFDVRMGRIIGPGIPEEDEFDEEEDAFSDQDVQFELDYCMKFPLSLPTTPMDLEADIAQGLEQLRSASGEEEERMFVLEDREAMDTTIVEEEEQVSEPAQPQPSPSVPSMRDCDIVDVFSPISPCFSPPPTSLKSAFVPYYSLASPITDAYFSSPSPYASPNATQSFTAPTASPSGMDTEERVLKSKWSSSTLSSVREEHERRGASSKLRLYFGGGSKRASGATRSSKVPAATPSSPSPFTTFMSPRKASTKASAASPPASTSTSTYTSSPLSPHNRSFSMSPAHSSPSPKSSPSPSHGLYSRAHPYSPSPKTHHRGSSNDVLVIGYGNNRTGVRRRGSVSTISSDAGTEVSSSSTSSSGLRRKPIPVEMFLRA